MRGLSPFGEVLEPGTSTALTGACLDGHFGGVLGFNSLGGVFGPVGGPSPGYPNVMSKSKDVSTYFTALRDGFSPGASPPPASAGHPCDPCGVLPLS